MFSRKNEEREGTPLPKSWTEEVQALLESTYQANLSLQNKIFEIFGLTYPDELLLMVSLKDVDTNTHRPPLTFMTSVDLSSNKDSKKILNTLVDSIGIFFDDVFASYDEDDQEYQLHWIKTEINNLEFYYKISREDIALSLQAQELLKEQKYG